MEFNDKSHNERNPKEAKIIEKIINVEILFEGNFSDRETLVKSVKEWAFLEKMNLTLRISEITNKKEEVKVTTLAALKKSKPIANFLWN